MKTNLRLLLALFVSAASLGAAPLASSTAVHSRPDAASPAIAVLKAGTEATPATDASIVAPPGWQAVELAGPHEVYVHGKDLTKNLDIKPNAEFRTQPKADAPVFSLFAPGDKAEITGLRGKWTQMKLEKKVIGYINVSGGATGVASNTATASQPAAAKSGSSGKSTAQPAAAAPVPAPAISTSGAPGRPVQAGDGGASALPRLFRGTLVSAKKLIGRSPYEFQLNDDGGARYAYLDVSKLLLTEQIDKYIDHTVVVYGTAKPVPNSKEIVIQVESLQLQ